MRYILSDDIVVDYGVASGTDATIDDTLYMSEVYYNKDINDIYSMLVSCRNCIILLIFVILTLEVHNIVKNAFKRHYKLN